MLVLSGMKREDYSRIRIMPYIVEHFPKFLRQNYV